MADTATTSSSTQGFEQLRTSDELAGWRAHLDDHVARRPDKTLAFKSRMPLLYGETDTTAAAYTCPMHPDVVSTEPGTCPQCGMKLVPAPTSYVCPMHPDVTSDTAGACPKCGMRLVPATAGNAESVHTHEQHHEGHGQAHDHDAPDGLEWEDLMPEINAASNVHNMIWTLVDVDTAKQNWEIDWAFRVGDLVKIRLLNDMDQDHPMHHPFHIHGAGRFLILARDDVVESNLAWKDTVLVRSGETVDILLEVTNPGLWMAHCHIAEHNQAGMMFSFPVRES